MRQVEMPPGASVRKDESKSLSGDGSLRLFLPPDQDAVVSAFRTASRPSRRHIRIVRWIQVQGIYGSGYAVVTVHEDDGSFGRARGLTL